MGKKSSIRIISGLIAGMTAHKILLKYTNKPESINHLESEVDNYRDNLSSMLTEFNWNDKDKEEIKNESKRILKTKLKESHFADVKFPANEPEKIIDETIIECGI